jgi:AcrR family transcriptional regulator
VTTDEDRRPSTAGERRRNARGEGDRLREQLLEATVALLSQEGDADRVSVRAIAKAAGVSPTALYLQFPDRDALVSAAVDRGFDAFNVAISAAFRAHDDPREQLRAMALAYLDFTEREPALYAVIFSTRRAKETPSSGEVERDRAFRVLLDAVAAAAPGLDEEGVHELSLILWSALHGYATLRARGSRDEWPGAERYADRLLQAHVP